VATRGWIDPSVEENYLRALALCGDREPCPEAAAARYGLATVTELRGQFAKTEELLSPLLDAEAGGDLAMEAHELVACSTFHQGAFAQSLENAGMVLDSWDEDAYSVPMSRIAEHPASSCNSWASLSAWCLGRPDESIGNAERAVTLGEQNRYALTTALQQRAMLHQLRHEPEACEFWANRTREVGGEQDYPMRVIQGDIYRGWALSVTGSVDEGLPLIEDGLARFREAGARLNEAYYLGLHADALLHANRPEDALAALEAALDTMRAGTRSYFFESELHRLIARAQVQAADDGWLDAARRSLDESLSVAEAQRSPALVLRTLTDRLELEDARGDPNRWRPALEAALTGFAGQSTSSDIDRARTALSR
jgi:predicted ATPase